MGRKKNQRIIILCDTWKLHRIQISMFTSKVVLEHNQAHFLYIVYDCFCTKGGAEWPQGPQSLKYLLPCPL